MWNLLIAPWPGVTPRSPASHAGRFFTIWATREVPRNRFITSRNSVPVQQSYLTPSSLQSLVTFRIISASVNLPILDMSSKLTHTISPFTSGLLHSTYFQGLSLLQHVSEHRIFFYTWKLFRCVSGPQPFIHVSVECACGLFLPLGLLQIRLL